MKTIDRISRARAALITGAPFFATLALSMDVHNADNLTATMATDGKSLFYNAAFVDQISDAELRGVIIHEVLHVALCHHTRRGNRDAKLWNVACDYVVNSIVRKLGFALPDGALFDSRWDGDTIESEAVYSALNNTTPDPDGDESGDGQDESGDGDGDGQDGNGDGQDGDADGDGQDVGGGAPGQFGDVLDAAPSHDKDALKAAEMDARTRVISAAQIAAAQGKADAFTESMLGKARQTPRDLFAVLANFCDESLRTSPSMARPNRRMIPHGVYMPSQMSDGMSRLGVVLDVSGSVFAYQDKLATFLDALNNARDVSAPDLTDVVQCDTAIRDRQEFEEFESVSVDLKGGGGTDMQPALDELAKVSPAAIIVFTDCEFWDAPTDPGVPVIWARWGNGNAPDFGELIDV